MKTPKSVPASSPARPVRCGTRRKRIAAGALAAGLLLEAGGVFAAGRGTGTVQIARSARPPAEAPAGSAAANRKEPSPEVPAQTKERVTGRLEQMRERHLRRQALRRPSRSYGLPQPPAGVPVPPRPDTGGMPEYLRRFGGAQ